MLHCPCVCVGNRRSFRGRIHGLYSLPQADRPIRKCQLEYCENFVVYGLIQSVEPFCTDLSSLRIVPRVSDIIAYPLGCGQAEGFMGGDNDTMKVRLGGSDYIVSEEGQKLRAQEKEEGIEMQK